MQFMVANMYTQTVPSTLHHVLLLVTLIANTQSSVVSDKLPMVPLSVAKRSEMDTSPEQAINDSIDLERVDHGSGESGLGEEDGTQSMDPSRKQVDASFFVDCALIALEVTEFTFVDDKHVLFRGETTDVVFWTQSGRPVVCSNFQQNGTIIVNVSTNVTTIEVVFPEGFAIASYVGCSLSVLASFFLLVTYTLFKELRTLPSLLLMSLTLAFLIGDLLILFGSFIASLSDDQSRASCVAVAVLLHYFFLARFSWTNMIASEMVRSFTSAMKLLPVISSSAKQKTFVVYSIFGWGIPLAITLITIIVNFTVDGLVRYGTETCWINDVNSALVAFIAPLVVSLVFNILSFAWIVFNLCKSSIQNNTGKRSQLNVRLYVAVFSVMGLTWIFGFLAILARNTWAWYPFIILNSTQALVVVVSFTCTKRIGRSYLELLSRDTPPSSSIHPNISTRSNKVSSKPV